MRAIVTLTPPVMLWRAVEAQAACADGRHVLYLAQLLAA
jgi:hypothetical protein